MRRLIVVERCVDCPYYLIDVWTDSNYCTFAEPRLLEDANAEVVIDDDCPLVTEEDFIDDL